MKELIFNWKNLAHILKYYPFATSPCRARTTLEEILLNLKVRGEEERKRTVLASLRKRTDILFHFN